MASGSLSQPLQETLELFDSEEPRTTPEIADQLDLGRRSTYARLDRLVERNRLETKKVGANARVWWRPSDRDSAEPFASLVEAVEEYAIFTLDTAGHVRTWNPGALRIKGYAADEIIGEHFSRFYTDEDRKAGVPEENLEGAEEHGSVDDEGWRVRADGSRFWASVTITAIRDDDGEIERFAKVTRDMTDRHEHEEALRRQRDFIDGILETAPVGVLTIERDGTFTVANKRASELLELEAGRAGTVGEKDVYDEDGAYIRPDERPYYRAFKTGEPIRNWYAQLELADGNRRWLSTNIEPMMDTAGEVERVLVTIEDVSQLKTQAQRLEHQRNDLRAELDEVFARIDDAFLSLDEEWRIDYVNDRAAELVRLSPGELIGARIWDILYELDDAEPRKLAEHAMETQQSIEFEYYSQLLEIWVGVRGYPSETGMSVYFRDITARKERENELERYETTVETVWDGVTMLNADERFIMVNEAFCEMTGYDREEIIGEHATLIIGEEEYRKAGELHARVEAGELDIADLEYDLQTADGGSIPVEARFGPCVLEDGSVGGTGVIRDVSERKRMETELRRSERKFRELAEHLEQVVWLTSGDMDELLYVNPAFEDIWGVERERLYEDFRAVIVESIHPEDREMIVDQLDTQIRGEFEADYRIVPPDGEVRWIHERATPIYDDDGSVYRVVGDANDITERKERERELEEYETILEAIPDGAYILDEAYRYQFVNEAYASMVGQSREELIGAHVGDVIEEEILARSRELREELRTGERPSARLDQFLHPADGDPIPVETRAIPLSFDEEFRGTAGVSRDISSRLEREQELLETKSQLEAATKAGEIGTWQWHLPENRFVAGEWLARLFGVDPADARKGVPIEKFVSAVHEDDRERVVAEIKEAIERCGAYEAEYRVWDAEDQPRWVVARGRVDCDEDGSPITFPGALTDITERKRAEVELERQRQQLLALNGLNDVVNGITEAVINQSTREEIEQTVCDSLVKSEAFDVAWIGEVDPEAQSVEPRMIAGVRDWDPERIELASEDAGTRSVRERDIQVVHDVSSAALESAAPGPSDAETSTSVALIPVIHAGELYGVLGVSTARESAFVAAELAVIDRLGEVIGHAITAAERKQALMSDELVELEFQIRDLGGALDVEFASDGRITFDHAIAIEEGEFLVYGTAEVNAFDSLRDLVDQMPAWEALTTRSRGDPTRFELRVSDPPVLSKVAELGGYFDTAVIADGDLHLTIHLAPSVDVRRIVETIESAYPRAELLRRRQITRSRDDLLGVQRRLAEDLTDRQRVTLNAAFHAGFFEWPRAASGEEVAESLGIAPATFSQHLRKAEKKVFESLFSSAAQATV